MDRRHRTTTRITTRAIAALLLVALATGCAMRPAAPPTRPLASPCIDCVPGIENFGRVTADLWRGDMPTDRGFEELHRLGVRTIINLRKYPDNPPAATAPAHAVHIPMSPRVPQQESVLRAIREIEDALADPARRPVFIHCGEGRDRAGYVIAAWRRVIGDWSADDAIHEMMNFRARRLLPGNPRFVREIDPAAWRTLLAQPAR